jgi:hypothetical protein
MYKLFFSLLFFPFLTWQCFKQQDLPGKPVKMTYKGQFDCVSYDGTSYKHELSDGEITIEVFRSDSIRLLGADIGCLTTSVFVFDTISTIYTI